MLGQAVPSGSRAMADRLAFFLWGRTRLDAWTAGECIRCGESCRVELLAPVDAAEYGISAMCPACVELVMEGQR